eukprot:125036_1
MTKQKAIQFILQTIFIILSQNDKRLRGDSSLTLVVFSLIGSILSVANKFLWFDDAATHPKARDSQIKKKMYCYCLSESNTDDIITQFLLVSFIKQNLNYMPIKLKMQNKPDDSEWCFYCITKTSHKSTNTFYHCTEDECLYCICDDRHQKYTFQYNKNECINLGYLLRFMWRFSFIFARFICLALICSVMGAAFFLYLVYYR